MQEISQNPAPQASDAISKTSSQSAFDRKPQSKTVVSEAQKRQEKILKKSKLNTFMLGLVALCIALGVALVFFVLSFFRQGSVDTLQDQVSDLKSQIAAIKKDENVVIASILKNNDIQSSLPLAQIITDFQKAATSAKVQLQGFNVQNGIITTTLIATESSQSHSDPALLIINMMRSYAQNKNTTFDLEPVTNISGTPDERTTSISFKIVASDAQ